MRKLTGFTKRIIAMLLSGMLIIGSASGSVFAADIDVGETSEVAEEVISEEPAESAEELTDASEEEAAEYYTVTLNANGGYFENEWDDTIGEYVEQAVVVDKVVPVGGTVAAVVPVLADQDEQTIIFKGWSLEPDGEMIVAGDEEYAPVDNCVLFAVWEAAESTEDESGDNETVEGSEITEATEEAEAAEEASQKFEDAESVEEPETYQEPEETEAVETVEETESSHKTEDTEAAEDTDITQEAVEDEYTTPKTDNEQETASAQEIIYSDEEEENSEESLDASEETTLESSEEEETVREDAANSVVASGTCGENLTWTLDSNGTFTVSGTGQMYNYYTFTSWQYRSPTDRSEQVSPDFFQDGSYKNVKRIIINEGVTSIGDGAFSYFGIEPGPNACGSFESISLPSTLKEIGASAFFRTGCEELTIGTGGSNIDIVSYAFDLSTFKKVVLGVKNPSGFSGTYSAVREIEILSGAQSLGCYANNSSLTKIVIPSGINEIGNYAFSGCKSLSTITLPEGITSIGREAFMGCMGLKGITLPQTLKTIGVDAFYESGLESIIIPKNVELMQGAFTRCYNLKSITFSKGITTISASTCNLCTSLTTITIPEGVTVIGNGAFYSCEQLSSISLPTTLTTIYSNAFGKCNSLKQITIPANVSAISLGAGGKLQEYSPFKGSENLTTINVASGNNTYKSYDGCLYNNGLTELIFCPEGKSSINIAPTTTSINQYAFVTAKYVGHSENDPKLNTINFKTCSPSIPETAFPCITATAYYNNFLGNWPSDKRQNYGGTITWVEKPLNLSECTMTISPTSYTYDGTAKKPTVTIKYNGTNLTNNTDYTVSYSNNTNAGTGTVTAIGKEHFTGQISKTFTIGKASPTLSFASSSVSKKTTDSSFTNTLTKKTDGTVTFSSSNTSVATVNSSSGLVTIKGAGKTTITANAAAGTNYNAGSASYTLTVVRQYTISYDANGGIGTPSSQFKQENVSLTLSSIKPTKRYTISYNSCGGSVSPASKNLECTFKNWNTSKNGSGTSYASGGNYSSNADATLYAQWTNPKAGELATPTRSGYAFAGWYTASSGGNPVTDSTTITGNVTFYAHWKDPYNLGDETYSFENYGDSDSKGGHCFGMSITSAGYENDFLNIRRIGGNANTPLYSFKDTPIVREPICYYQSKQGSCSTRATVAGGSVYKTGTSNIDSDWQEVVNYVKNHKYDNTGLLQIGFRKGLGGHAINFLRYEYVNGQDRIYAYDNNFPSQETYFYEDEYGRILQAPVQTFRGAIDCIALRDSRIYYSIVGSFDSTRALYMAKDDAYVPGYNYSLMDGAPSGENLVMYEIPADQERVTIIPNRDNADFIYMDTEFSFGEITDSTRGELIFSSMDEQSGGLDASFIIYEESESALIPTVTLSKTTFTYNGKVQKPSVTVKAGSTVLTESQDYIVEYPSGMVDVGPYKVKVTLIGNYSGVLYDTFEIVKAAQPLAASNLSLTYLKNGTIKVSGNKGKLSYKSSNTSVATVDSTGKVTAKGAGKATITITAAATSNYNAATKTITVNVAKAAQSITAKAGASTIAVGKTTTVSITGNKGTKSYKSSNTTIATVTSAGKVTAKKVGTVKITATSAATAQYNAASKTVTIKVVPAATASLTAANQATGIKLTWKKVTGANGYKVYRGSTLIKTITSVNTVTFADTKANTNGTKYTYKVVAKASTGDSTLSKSVAVYRVARPAISSVTNSASKKMTVKWGKNAKANGYQIQYSTDKTFKSGNKALTVTGASTVSKVIGSLTKGKTYYVRIRTYKTVGRAKYWSVWSSARSVKIRK